MKSFKTCSRCHASKARSEFNKATASKDGLQCKCRDCSIAVSREYYHKNIEAQRARARARNKERQYGQKDRERNKRWALANPEQARHHSRKKLLGKKYGMTIEEHDALFATQGFACGACGSPSPGSKKGWSTDHCHKTGVVRGIVCHHCNIGIGHAKDSITTIRSWIAYLERSGLVEHAPPSVRQTDTTPRDAPPLDRAHSPRGIPDAIPERQRPAGRNRVRASLPDR